jgi:hypothetical protein
MSSALPTDASVDVWPDGFGNGRRDQRALLVLSALRGITPRSLIALARERGSASPRLHGSGRGAPAARRIRRSRARPAALGRERPEVGGFSRTSPAYFPVAVDVGFQRVDPLRMPPDLPARPNLVHDPYRERMRRPASRGRRPDGALVAGLGAYPDTGRSLLRTASPPSEGPSALDG